MNAMFQSGRENEKTHLADIENCWALHSRYLTSKLIKVSRIVSNRLEEYLLAIPNTATLIAACNIGVEYNHRRFHNRVKSDISYK